MRQSLRLGRLAEPIRQAWRAGELDAATAEAAAAAGEALFQPHRRERRRTTANGRRRNERAALWRPEPPHPRHNYLRNEDKRSA